MILLGAALASAISCGKGFEGNTGGSGPTPQSCTSTADCTVPTDPCTTVSCQNSSCLYVQRQNNVPLPDEHQIQGDCQTIVCNQGTSTTKPIPNDPPDGDACLSYSCVNGDPKEEFADAETPCGEGGLLSCDGNGNCGGCTQTAQCGTPPTCKAYTCVDMICETSDVTNTNLPDNESGDCLQPRCNETGNLVFVPKNDDFPPDPMAGDCSTPTCVMGQPEEAPEAPGSACSVPEAGACCGFTCCPGSCVAQMCVNQGGGGLGGMGIGGAGGLGVGGAGGS